MTDTVDDFRGLMQQLRQGSDEAAWQLVEQYGEPIRRAVRRALSTRMRTQFDSLDFVQLVWSSFFRVGSNLERFDRPEDLAAFLVAMTRNKVGMEARRRLMTEKYNLNKERSLDAMAAKDRAELPDREPLPLEVAIAREQWERMLDGKPEHYRKIIHLRLQGYTNQQIADSLQLAESTVRRFLKRLFRETVV